MESTRNNFLCWVKKFELKLLLIFLFSVVSLGLSFKVKKTSNELSRLKTNLVKIEQQNNMLNYQLDVLQEAFALNFGLAHEPLLMPDVLNAPAGRPMALLYLKDHACSPCNMPVIQRLVDQGWQQNGFRIVSHLSNRYFLMQALGDEELDDQGKVSWVDHPIYAKETTQYDAELLLIDNQGLITGLLPLELMKEGDVFADFFSNIYQNDE